MAVFRIERTRDYTVMSNHHLRNANLSLKAKGLLSMILSLPEEWNYTMELNYIKCGDYYVPDIRLKHPNIRLGHYGMLRKGFLTDPNPILFSELVLSEKLFEHCAEIEAAARTRLELIVPELAKRNGVTEQLKAENQLEWVRQMNACKAQAEEIIKYELIYC